MDLAADPKRTALCAIDWSSGSIELSDGPVDDDAIVALAHRAPLSGWDVPLGWPDAFVAGGREKPNGPGPGGGGGPATNAAGPPGGGGSVTISTRPETTTTRIPPSCLNKKKDKRSNKQRE